jgi:hypothetical protein
MPTNMQICDPLHNHYMMMILLVKENNILEFDRILFPVHVSGDHWTLGCIDMNKHLVEFYDSLGKCPPAGFYDLVKRWLWMMGDTFQVDVEIDGEMRTGLSRLQRATDPATPFTNFAVSNSL